MKIKTTLIIIAVVLIADACKKKQDDTPTCTAGSGGNVTFVVYAKHGSTSIPNYYTHLDTAFVRYGTTSSPGTNPSNYNTYFVSEPGEDHIHCTGMKCGDYFIYRTAWDSVTNTRRYGGQGISFSETSGEKDLIISVN